MNKTIDKTQPVALVGLLVLGLLVGILMGNLTAHPKTITKTVTKTVATAQTTPKQTGPKTSFGDGVYQVGVDIQAGTYKTAGPSDPNEADSCYYKRLSDLTGNDGSIIDSELVNGPATVQILPTDAGFSSDGCQTWTLVQ